MGYFLFGQTQPSGKIVEDSPKNIPENFRPFGFHVQ